MSTAAAAAELPRLIRASAGTGKTYQLSNRFLQLLAQGAASDQLLASTFTRKAAGEILDRILRRLADAVLDESECEQLRAALEQPQLVQSACENLLDAVVGDLHRVRVSTLDSFFSQLARTFSLELGLPPGWQIVEELEDDQLQTEAIDALLRADDPANLRTLVHLLTKGEAQRGISELVRSTVRSLYPLYQQTEAAAWKSIPRPKQLTAVEFTALLEELESLELPTKRMRTARDADCQRAREEDWMQCLKVGMTSKVLQGTNVFYAKPIPEPAVALYQRLLKHVSGHLVAGLIDQTEATYKLLERYHRHYQKLKQERRALRFDDITARLAAAASSREKPVGSAGELPDLRDVDQWSFRLDGGIEHLMLDEFQDTSITQWDVVRPFARRVVGHRQRSFFCVGDTKQAIYGWRGGVAEIFDALPGELGELDCQPLNRSYRSSPAVIENVNRVFKQLARHTNLGTGEDAVRRWCEQFPEHETARDLPGYTCLQSSEDPGTSKQERQASCFDRAAEVVQEITEQAPWASVGVLLRSNDAVAQVIYRLRARRVPCSQEGGNPLTDSAAVQLIMSLLQLCDHPSDTVAEFHVRHSALGKALGLGAERAEDIARNAWRVAREARRALLEEGYGPAIAGWAEQLAAHCDRRELSRLRQLVELAYSFQPRATLRTSDFLALLDKQRVSDPTSAAVRVMTVHQSKGLEFDVVVLPQLDEDLIGQPDAVVVQREHPTGPIARVCRYAGDELRRLLPAEIQAMFQETTDRAIRESLCLLYVALTRAAYALHMIIPASRDNEAKIRRGFDGLLRAALTDGRRVPKRAILAETGDPNWHRDARLADRLLPSPPPVETPATSGPLLLPAATSRRRELERSRPSDLEGGGQIELEHWFEPGAAQAMARGTVIHAWFEAIDWLDDPLPDEAKLRDIAAKALQEAECELEIDALLKDFRKMLDLPAVDRILRRDSYPPTASDERRFAPPVLAELKKAPLQLQVRNEHAFAVRYQGGLLNGTIDRLVLMTDPAASGGPAWAAAEILDYKTDLLTADGPQSVEQKCEFYRPQLHAYRTAVEQMTGLPAAKISTGLIFLSTGELHFV